MFSSNTSQVSEDRLYVEDVFSTFVYAGNGSTQTITNGIDLAGKGGMVWSKARTQVYSEGNAVADTARGAGNDVFTNLTYGYNTGSITSFNSNGFSLSGGVWRNSSGQNYASWTFRKAPKFFDVVTYTGNGVSIRNFTHSLGVAPGFILVKRTDSSSDWFAYHRSRGAQTLVLNSTAAAGATYFDAITNVSSIAFGVGPDDGASGPTSLNVNGATYVAYLFAHDTASDGIIQCGSFTTAASGYSSINLGWEPQWVLIKTSGVSQNWQIFDNMRSFPVTGNSFPLFPNLSNAEDTTYTDAIRPTSTGFDINADYFGGSRAYIYIAIRRGPMRTPTTGTSVFAINNNVLSDATKTTSGIVTDLFLERPTKSGTNPFSWVPRMTRGYMDSNATTAENVPGTGYFAFDYMDGFLSNLAGNINPGLLYSFRRAPGFFDVVCYTGTGAARTVSHNLGVAPELMIVKNRTDAVGWLTYSSALGVNTRIFVNSNAAAVTNAGYGSAYWNSAAPTASVLNIGTDIAVNNSGSNYVAYLFASCPGVSKVFSFTGNGSSQTINCGFSGGARFILIKRTDSTGNWVVFDSARGIVSGNDPSLLLNSTAAETNYDDIDPDSSGFVVNQSTNNLNVNGASYIGLAIS